jgi:hypothetical protein
MSTRAFRIKVRGEFKELTEGQRAELLARAAEHDALSAAFTPEGHLSYDLAAATERAEAVAAARLNERGRAFRLLKSQAEDLSQAPMSKRQRRSQRQA